jgi:pyruvate formate lyase activating enzyme
MMGGEPDSRFYTVGEVVNICLEDEAFYRESGGGVTLSGGEALAQHEFSSRLLEALKEKKIHTALETSGFAEQGIFLKLASLAGLILFDLKHYDPQCHREGTGVDNAPILANLKLGIEAGLKITPRIPVIPGFNSSIHDAEAFAKILKESGLKEAQLLPFHQMGSRKYELLQINYSMKDCKALYPEDLEDYKNTFTANGINAFF